MSENKQRHCDCRNYAHVDVVKGICHRSKNLVAADDAQCPNFVALSKCKNCTHFSTAQEEFMGVCNAEAAKPWTYPDLIAINCKQYNSAIQ
jgi:4-hydroxyphenylacetate decarboxylase small subunit